MWVLPDCYFGKHDATILPLDSRQRRLEGALSAAAPYLTEEIATAKTSSDFWETAISHGWIRMSNEDLLRL